MRNLLALLATLVLLFAGLGWYFDWYHINTTPAPGGHHSVNIDFDSRKIEHDVEAGVQQGREKLRGVMDKESLGTQEKPPQPVKSEHKPTAANRSETNNPGISFLPRIFTGEDQKPAPGTKPVGN